ncbi:DUF1546-domain-containing protein [Ramicandelaber brevisporus]|nr:DUF1546-domain-containing protein [Ramicandelaber brevisporus]
MHISKDSIKAIAEAAGIGTISDSVATFLAADVEFRLQEVVEQARKTMRHSKRTTLQVDDISAALRMMSIEPIYGYAAQSNVGPVSYSLASTGSEDIFYIEEAELDIDEIIHAPLPPAPLDTVVSAHWLAVEGVQPAIKQNPTPEEIAQQQQQQQKDKADIGQQATPQLGSTVFPNAAAAASGTLIVNGIAPTPHADQSKSMLLVRHTLSAELIAYFERINELAYGSDDFLRAAAFDSLSVDPGIHQLIPYWVQHVADQVTVNMRKPAVLLNTLQIITSLMANPRVHLDSYLHQLMPSALTCVLGKRLHEDPLKDNHWALRRAAARLVNRLCENYGHAYHSLQQRTVRTLLRAFLDVSKPLATQFGALIALAQFSNDVVRTVILPNLPQFCKMLDTEESRRADDVMRLETAQCRDAVVFCFRKLAEEDKRQQRVQESNAMEIDSPSEISETESDSRLRELYGSRIAALLLSNGLSRVATTASSSDSV